MAAGGTGSIEKNQVRKTVKQKEMAAGGTGSTEKNQVSKYVEQKDIMPPKGPAAGCRTSPVNT